LVSVELEDVAAVCDLDRAEGSRVLGVVAVIGGLHRQRRLAGSAAHASRWQPLIILATGLTSAMPSCVQGRQLVIADIEAVHAELAGRGTPGPWHELFAREREEIIRRVPGGVT
jgi:hypothetical protein